MKRGSVIFKWIEGETLGDTYLLKERLGRGSYGIVGKATRLKDSEIVKTGDVVALKVPIDQNLGEENLRRESEIMRGFSHENIVKVYGHYTVSGVFVIEMELVEGHSLSAILDNQNFVNRQSLVTVLNWIRQVVLGLRSMGEFAHGDIKPQNILIRNDGVVKLVDFGTSRRLTDVWVYTKGHGTEQYMAPEVALENTRVSMKSDLYSIGVILYEIATGDVPFHSNLERLQGKELVKPREINSDIPIVFERLILRCLERDPDLRYATWEGFLEDLDAVIVTIRERAPEKAMVPETHRYKFRPDSSSPLYFLDKAKQAMESEDYQGALKNAEAAVAASEGHPTYLQMLGAICLRIEYYEKAKAAFSRLLEKYDHGYPVETNQLAYVLRKLAELYIQTQDYETAVQFWTRFMDVSEDKPLAKFKLAIAFGLNGQYKRAISLLEEVRAECPEVVVVYSKLGWAYYLAGDFRQALSYYNQALVIEPTDLFSLFELGQYYRIRGDHRRAARYFERIQRYDRTGEYVAKVRALYEE
jgi:serine/threonine protein kinase/Tfp pilus assembly protein PilF